VPNDISPPAGEEITERIDGRQAVLGRERDDALAMHNCRRIGRYDQGAARCALEDLDRTFDVRHALDTGGHNFQGKCSRGSLGPRKVVVVGRCLWVAHDKRAGQVWRDLLEHR
jgi:hypothetical protein